ncbi:hypothetical protein DICPUDRAFT_77486 [Dictyostelium purpureum]|uniref:Uncharacterized protein n=1 Tax=Dictyostelium purpureum TaxID=5786 RepID=F0ZGR3_DICPU|nr:uncharacterized protein DICPUDRAFT_77486 [Dictyostelium purpureum]EGC36890.1 hypothetical protein DICPUDRAFT_77486 [Dictyostelium purpureum]|eukprot:XP_003286612.1 hypothetical protein DICPUDRAFT_77486 [Dictyostelium purpureum]
MDNSIVFFKLWRNKIIKNEIQKWNRYLIKVNDWRIREFKTLESYEESKDNYFIKSIIMVNCFGGEKSLIEFFNNLPSNIESVEIKGSKISIEIKAISVPPTLKSLRFDNNIIITEKEDIKDLSNLSYQMNGLETLYLGFRGEEIMKKRYIPYTLKHLVLSCLFDDPIYNQALPEGLESLELTSEYYQTTLHFPNNLKHFIYCKSYKLYSSVFKQLPSSIESLRLDCNTEDNNKPIKSLEIAKKFTNLKKLSVSYNCFIQFFADSILVQGAPLLQSLTKLEIIRKGFFSMIDNLDIDLLPPTLIKLKLSHMFFRNKTGRGFPASLTSLETSLSGFRSHFENASNIQYIAITSKEELDQSNVISFDKFPNLKSLKYYYLEKVSSVLLPINILSNLEISCTVNFKSQPIELKKLNNLKSLKLDLIYTQAQFDNAKTITLKPFPNSIQLLDLTINKSDTIISNQNLPQFIKILIIRGTSIPNFILPLPETLETILFSKQIKNVDYHNNTTIQKLSQSHNIQTFYHENDKKYYSKPNYSKLYNKIKNKIIV